MGGVVLGWDGRESMSVAFWVCVCGACSVSVYLYICLSTCLSLMLWCLHIFVSFAYLYHPRGLHE